MNNIDAKKIKSRAHNEFSKGNYSHGISLLKQLDPNSDPEINLQIQLGSHLLARRYWRQNNPEKLSTILPHLEKTQPHVELALARLKGKIELGKIACGKEGIHATLAQCVLQEDLKAALLTLRREQSYKALAEGWLALLKRDIEKAKSNFLTAQEEHPSYAKIGLGTIALVQNNLSEAAQLLHFFSTSSPLNIFPQMAKGLFLNNPAGQSSITLTSQLTLYLNHTSLEELLVAIKKIKPNQKDLLGWMLLKIGDHQFQRGEYSKALKSWQNATFSNPLLKMDVLKRNYLTSFKSGEGEKVSSSFFDLYRALLSKSPSEAKAFVDHQISHGSELYVDRNKLRTKSGWSFKSTQVEMQFVWLHRCYIEDIKNSMKIIRDKDFFAVELCSLPLSEWESIFVALDPHYDNQELYLREKSSVYCYFNSSFQIVKTIVSLLKISPHLKEEFLPILVRSLHTISLALDRITDDSILAEINQLLKLYPSDFDLIRFSINFSPPDETLEYYLSKYQTLLSDSLWAVLRLQVHIDRGYKLAACRTLIPNEELLLRSREAEWRLVAALLTPSARFQKKEIEVYINKLFTSPEEKHFSFSKILQSTGYAIPPSILKKWEKENQRDWRPKYHFIYHYAKSGDEGNKLKYLYQTFQLINPNLPEFAELDATCRNGQRDFFSILDFLF